MSDYIMDLRKVVGHRPLLQVGASVIVVNEKGETLLQKRADNHCWGYAGGMWSWMKWWKMLPGGSFLKKPD